MCQNVSFLLFCGQNITCYKLAIVNKWNDATELLLNSHVVFLNLFVSSLGAVIRWVHPGHNFIATTKQIFIT
jgi:hypothetical protein